MSPSTFARTEFRNMLDKFYLLVPCSEESGTRTPEHNKAIGGAPDSAHVHGVAQDLILDLITDLDAALYHAKRIGFYGIEWDARNRHLHLDRHLSMRRWWVRIGTDGVVTPLSPSLAEI